MSRPTFIFLTIRALLALCVVGLVALPVFAHSWYDPDCCGGNDCAPIPDTAVTLTAEGWKVRLEPGEHPMVTRGPIEVIVPDEDVRPSRDANFHACVRDQSSPSAVMTDPVICLYVPGTS